MALGWKGRPDSISGWPLSTPEDVQVFVGDCHSLASQHVFSSAAAGFLPRGGRLGQLTA